MNQELLDYLNVLEAKLQIMKQDIQNIRSLVIQNHQAQRAESINHGANRVTSFFDALSAEDQHTAPGAR